jgi:hypothetical protein
MGTKNLYYVYLILGAVTQAEFDLFERESTALYETSKLKLLHEVCID